MGPADPLLRYQIMEPLGAGGQGHTFRAIDRERDTVVAIKVLSLRKLDNWRGFDRFEREAAVLRALKHPGIPRYLDSYASEATGDFFLVMELVEGRTLHALIAQEPRLSGRTLRSIFDQALDILEYLHGLHPPVVHRDIKPANLLLDPRGRLHLVDFGGVRPVVEGEGMSTAVGTFGYMAPEQLYGTASPSSDLYALAASVASVVGGKPAEALAREGLRIDTAAIELPAFLREVLPAMLEPDPGQRIKTVQDVRTMLARVGGRTETPPTERASGPRSASQALAEIPQGARDLARVPAPLSIFVWLLASLAAGGLVVFEAVVLPIVRRALMWWFRAKHEQRRQFELDYRRFRGQVRRGRRFATYVAGHTKPVDDHDEATPRDDTRR